MSGIRFEKIVYSEDQLQQAFSDMRREFPMVVKAQPYRRRNQEASNLFHLWVDEIRAALSKKSGMEYPKEWVKTLFKRRWGPREEFTDPATGEVCVSLKSESRYTKGELYHVMIRVEEYAASLGITLTMPDGEYADYKKEQGL